MLKKFSLLYCLLCLSGIAQINVSSKPTKPQFVAHESVGIVISLTNRTGTEVILKGSGLENWLNINIYDSKRNLLPYVGGKPAFKGVRIPAGQSVKKVINLSQFYDLTRYGTYNYTVSVKLPGNTKQAVQSTSRQISITNARVIAKQKIGVPGTPSARTYEVLRLNGKDRAYMYVKITNDQNGRVVVCRQLSQVNLTREPSIAVDGKSDLHLVYKIKNDIYIHLVVDPTGKNKTHSYHKRGAFSEPSLITFANGDVKVTGNVPYDPEAERKKAEEGRKLSERPEFR